MAAWVFLCVACTSSVFVHGKQAPAMLAWSPPEGSPLYSFPDAAAVQPEAASSSPILREKLM